MKRLYRRVVLLAWVVSSVPGFVQEFVGQRVQLTGQWMSARRRTLPAILND